MPFIKTTEPVKASGTGSVSGAAPHSMRTP